MRVVPPHAAAKRTLLDVLAQFAADPRVTKTCIAAVGVAEIPGVDVALGVACVAAATSVAGDKIGNLLSVAVATAFDAFAHCAGADECAADRTAAATTCAQSTVTRPAR